MFKRFLHGLVLLALLAGMLAFAPVAPAAASADSKGVSPAGMLNPDGTLKLDGSFSGALDLDGYNVQLDPALGPVLAPIAAQDNWAAAAEGGGAFKDGIYTILVNGTDVYVGGSFLDAGGDPTADRIAKWDGSQWTALSNNGSGGGALNNSVYALFWYSGNLYVGGQFTAYDTGGAPISNASKLAMWNGSTWSAVPGISPALSNHVYAFGFDATNHILYIGGAFTNMNGDATADYLAGMDLDTSTLVTLGNNGAGEGSLNQEVRAIGIDSAGNVYAGGYFTDVNNGGAPLAEADRIAKWDGVNWSALGNNGAGVGALINAVNAIAIDGSNNVYAGGWFSDAAGIAEADYIAKWNGSAWSALGSNGAGNGALIPGNGTPVQKIAINGSDIYVGGAFTGSSGIPTADYAARFDTGTNTWYGLGSDGSGNGALNNPVIGMTFSGGNLYFGGTFSNVNDSGTVLPTADYFAIWDGSNWSTLGDPNGALNQTVHALAVIGSDVYVGGEFANFGGDSRMDYLVRWDGVAWNPVGNLTQSNGSLNSWVMALAVDGTDLYAGGLFSSAQNEGSVVVGASRIAKWNGSTWSALGGGMSGNVYALAVDSSHNVYAGGPFTDAASISEADYIAMWNGSAWSALAGNGAGNGALNAYVSAIAVSGSNVYAGGYFTSVVDTSNTPIPNAAYLAKWNGSTWSAMDGITSPLSHSVNALAISGSDLYVGGRFENLNGMNAADAIAKWDGSTWSALGSGTAGNGSLGNTQVYAITVSGNNVYVGGQVMNANNGGASIPEADFAVKWDALTGNWSALGHDGGGNGSLNHYVYVLQIVDNDLWVGGSFTNAINNGTVIPEADFLAAYGIDATSPTVSSITRADANPTSAASVDFTVTFSESVTGVGTSDFTPVQSGVSGATVSGISGSGDTYTVTVTTGTGNGTLGLDLTDDDSILDLAGNPLGGVGAGNGDFTGEVYTVNKRLPADGAFLPNKRPTFDWDDIPGAIGYQLQVAKTAAFSFGTLTKNSAVSNYTFTTDLAANTLYYWRVRAKLTATTYGPWLTVFTFTTGNPPSVPTLVSPANNALQTNLSPTLDWSNSTVPAGTTFDHYQVQVDDTADFSSPVVDANSAASTAVVGPLSANTKYYWRARAWNTAGHYSGWSAVRNFREAMLAPTLVSPIGGVTVGSLKPLFDWSDVTGATGYSIQVSLSAAFNSFAINATINSPTSQYMHSINLQAGKLYYWRVRANGPNGPSAWSVTETFHTP